MDPCADNMMVDIKTVFLTALEQDTDIARCAYLDGACADNPQLRQQVDKLLTAHGEAQDFLDPEAFDANGSLHRSACTEAPGTVIDRYEILETIGEGGMAMVYLAEQKHPIQRQVALKIIKPGMDTKQVIARFEVERQALALMDHPHIAKVLDAGVTHNGRPYFVMERVKGLSITDFCDQHKLSTQQRLELFTSVCQAVHHAHQKGIIHRDLKPSNILVSLQDNTPVPKIIDFGIAKATGQKLTDKTLFTQYTHLIGTPEYMSPEQAEMSGTDIDIRTDIYSLGIVLYELLVGTPPFDTQTLRKAAIAEIQRIIREEEPTRPSTRIALLGKEAEAIAARRCDNVAGLSRRLSRELEWIPLKAMRKERQRRYTSASEFADDINNYLNERPLLAGPESTLYRLQKALHKHRVPLAAIAAVIVVLIAGLTISSTLYVRLHRAISDKSVLEKQVDTENRLDIVRRLYRNGDYQAARNELETAFEDKDPDPQAKLLHAQLLMEVGELTDAEEKLNQLTDAESAIASTAHYWLARIHLDDPTQAEYYRKQAEALHPRTAEGYYQQAMAAVSTEEAITKLTVAIRLDPQHYEAREARALAFNSIEAYEDMALDAESLITGRPQDYLGHALRAIAQRETGHYDEALQDHARAIDLCHLEDERPRLYNQRRQTYMHSGNYQAALEDAKRHKNQLHVFTALTALGEYDRAQAIYREVAQRGTRPARHFKAGLEGHVFEHLNSGLPLDLPAEIALKSPFHLIPQAKTFYTRFHDKGRALPTASWMGDWSRDGRSIVYSRYGAFSWLPKTRQSETSGRGRHFIETLDLHTGKTQQITRFGNSPLWSPDGRTIAFSDMTKAGMFIDMWLVPSTGGTPRRLTEGVAVKWSHDSRRLYFRTFPWGRLCSIAVDSNEADPVAIPGFSTQTIHSCAISPDEKHIAIYTAGAIQIHTFPEGREVTRWDLPWPLGWSTQLQWHPNGKTLFLTSISDYNQMGICLFDIDHSQATHIFNVTRPWCNRLQWSADGSQLIVEPYYGEARLLDIDPETPLEKALAPALTTEDFLSMLRKQWDERIEANPLDTEHYTSRAVTSMAVNDFKAARQDINHCTSLISEPNDPARYILQYWANLNFGSSRLTEAESWALGNARIAERFPEYSRTLNWQQHPYQQLMQIYALQGDRQALLKWQEKWLQVNPLAHGSLNYEENTDTYRIAGSGCKIGNTWDECHFAYKALQGDGSITAKVAGNDGRLLTRGGVMIRNTLEPDARNATLLVTRAGKVIFQHRQADLQDTAGKVLGSIKAHWIKLERKGIAFTAHYSEDGVQWEAIKPDASSESDVIEIDMNDTVYIGLVVTSRAGPHIAAKAAFSNVTITGDVDSGGPLVTSKDIGFGE
jgi:serine/threonine protein kinase